MCFQIITLQSRFTVESSFTIQKRLIFAKLLLASKEETTLDFTSPTKIPKSSKLEPVPFKVNSKSTSALLTTKTYLTLAAVSKFIVFLPEVILRKKGF